MIVFAGQFGSSVMNTLTSSVHVGLTTFSFVLMRTEVPLSAVTTGRPERASRARAPLMSVTTQSIRRFLLLLYSHSIHAFWVIPVVAAASKEAAVLTLLRDDREAMPTSASPFSMASRFSLARALRSTAT